MCENDCVVVPKKIDLSFAELRSFNPGTENLVKIGSEFYTLSVTSFECGGKSKEYCVKVIGTIPDFENSYQAVVTIVINRLGILHSELHHSE